MLKLSRFSLVTVLTLVISSASYGATLTISADQATYGVGDPITITITGDSAGAPANGVFGALVLSGSGGATITGATQSQISSFGGALPWGLGAVGGAQNVAFDQIAGTTAFPGDWASPLATLTFSADSVGVVNFDWNTDVPSGYGLNFFGLTDNSGGGAPGTSVTIVPEPTTAAMMVLGLLVLSARRRSIRA